MEITILGAGAMGSLYAAILSKTNTVSLVDSYAPVVDAINKNGITVQEQSGEVLKAKVPATLSGEKTNAPELLIVFVKSTATEAALKENTGLIGENTVVLSLQNGLGNDETLKKFVPETRIVLGTSRHNSVVTGLGEIFHSGAGVTTIGGKADETTLCKIKEAFNASGLECVVEKDVKHLLWSKLFVNMSINAVTAVLDTEIGKINDDVFERKLAESIIKEAVLVAKADGEEFDAETVINSVMQTALKLCHGKASMCQDMERGRKTEIDFINGAVVRLGKKYGIATPVNQTVCLFVKAKENK